MELWQTDVVGRVLLADGTACEVLSGVDGHSPVLRLRGCHGEGHRPPGLRVLRPSAGSVTGCPRRSSPRMARSSPAVSGAVATRTCRVAPFDPVMRHMPEGSILLWERAIWLDAAASSGTRVIAELHCTGKLLWRFAVWQPVSLHGLAFAQSVALRAFAAQEGPERGPTITQAEPRRCRRDLGRRRSRRPPDCWPRNSIAARQQSRQTPCRLVRAGANFPTNIRKFLM